MEIQQAMTESLNVNIENEQNKFLDSTLGKIVNTGIDIGIRALLPDLIDEQVIDLKDNLLNHGLKEGISKTINDVVTVGKDIVGIFKGEITDINDLGRIIDAGEMVNGVSNVLDVAINKAQNSGVLNSTIASILQGGKNLILENTQNNIQETIQDQSNIYSKTATNIEEWHNSYAKKDFNQMDKNYKAIMSQLEKLLPLENLILKAREVENIHNIIKNNGHNFNLTEEQLVLASKL